MSKRDTYKIKLTVVIVLSVLMALAFIIFYSIPTIYSYYHPELFTPEKALITEYVPVSIGRGVEITTETIVGIGETTPPDDMDVLSAVACPLVFPPLFGFFLAYILEI